MASMTSARAKKLQDMLNRLIKPKPPLEVDGIIGDKTEAALKLLQGKAGLKKTGEIDSETAAVITRAMTTGKIEKEQPVHFYKVNGKYVGMTQKQYAAFRKKLIGQLRRGPLGQMRGNVVTAEAEWEHFDALNRDQWFVSTCIEFTRGVDLPKKSVIAKARKAYNECEAAVSSGNLKRFADIYPKCEKTVNDTVVLMRAYRENMIDGGGNWVTGLTFTKTASFTFVGVFAAPVTGAALGTGVVASAMIGGAAVSVTQTAAGEVGNWSAGQANWTPGGALKNTLIDGGIGAITGFLTKGASGGKHVVEAAIAKLAPKLAKETGFKLLSTTTVKKATLYLMTEGAKKTLEGVLADIGKAAKGDKKMTIDKFLDNLAVNFIKGVGMGPVGKVIEKFAKNAAGALSEKDKKRIWDVVLKEVAKQAKGETISVDMIDQRTRALVDKIVNDQIAKNLDNVIAAVYDNWKGPMSPAALEKKLVEEFLSPARLKAIAALSAKPVKKNLKTPAN